MKDMTALKKRQSMDRGSSHGKLQDYDLHASCRLCTTLERSANKALHPLLEQNAYATPCCLDARASDGRECLVPQKLLVYQQKENG